ncbi:hypothetical protein [Nocardia abscessus]|uniref:hypothetical protein n=1 Tax=Nocardia abscessus TaxID=120957 RepID=UPI0024537604|nr:hypothetical protein [Nocardia abscessus]
MLITAAVLGVQEVGDFGRGQSEHGAQQQHGALPAVQVLQAGDEREAQAVASHGHTGRPGARLRLPTA